MKPIILAAALAMAAGPALAQQAPAAAAAAPAAAAAGLSVESTPISEIAKNDAAKAALEKAIPEIAGFYDQIGDMTLSALAPMSQGALDDAKLKDIQAEFDAINAKAKPQ